MLNKLLLFIGIAVSAILVIENMVAPMPVYVLWGNWASHVLSAFSVIIWVLMWYWLKWIVIGEWKDADLDSSDNSDF